MVVLLQPSRSLGQSLSLLAVQTFAATPPAAFPSACFARGRASFGACPAGLLGRQASGTAGLVCLAAGLASSAFFLLATLVSDVLRLMLLLPGAGEDVEEAAEEPEREAPCPDFLDFLSCWRRSFLCCCCLILVGERITEDDGGAVGVGVELLAALSVFVGACIDAIKLLFPEAKFARVGRFFMAGEFLDGWRCWFLVCFAAAASLAFSPPRVNLIAGTSGDGVAAVLLRRAWAMWYSFDSPAGTKTLRGGDGVGDEAAVCFLLCWDTAAGAGTGTVGFDVVTSGFIS
jgi:hypothetical protein